MEQLVFKKREIPTPPKTVQARIGEEEHNKVKAIAEQTDESTLFIYTKLLRFALEHTVLDLGEVTNA